MKIRSIYTRDRMNNREDLKNLYLNAVVLTPLVFLLVMCVKALGEKESGEGAFGWPQALVVFAFMTSIVFASMSRTTKSGQYYLASIPYTGIHKVVYLIFNWTMWIPMLISYYSMKKGTELHRLVDEETQRVLRANLKRRLNNEGLEERFSEKACKALLDYCHREMEATGRFLLRCDHDVAVNFMADPMKDLEEIKKNPDVIRMEQNSLGHLAFFIQAYYSAGKNGAKYDLGEYELTIGDDHTFHLHLERSGKLSNEQPLPDTIEKQLIKYVNSRRGDLDRYIYTGRISKLLQWVIYRLQDGAVIEQQAHYDVSQHYHRVPDVENT